MRIFAFEFFTGGGLAARPMIAGMVEAGDQMLRALVTDLSRIRDVEVVITRDVRLGHPGLPARTYLVKTPDDLARCWDLCLNEADCVWPIAPETDGILEELCAKVENAGLVLLNSASAAVRLTASKTATAEHLAAHGLPVVDTWRADKCPHLGEGRWVLKPERGVGCQDTRLLRNTSALDRALDALGDGAGEWAVQPFLSGEAASLSLVVGSGRTSLLACNRQRVVLADDGFALLGCVVNGLEGDRGSYDELGCKVASSIPGLRGYVGVDLLVTRDGPVVMEVNPRLTTSYAGLGRSLDQNVAEMVLAGAGLGGMSRVALPPGRSVEVDAGASHVQ